MRLIDADALIAKLTDFKECDWNNKLCVMLPNAVDYCIEFIDEQPTLDRWIPVTERMPEDCDNRYYMCILENHEDDLPTFCQYDETFGFGSWIAIHDIGGYGSVDFVFKTTVEEGLGKVIAWMPLPELPKEEE